MLHPPFQRTEEEGEGANNGQTRSCGVVEGQPRRVENHPPVPHQPDETAVDPQTPSHHNSAAPPVVCRNHSSGFVEHHPSASAGHQWTSFAEQQSPATAEPYSSGSTEYLSSASSEHQSLASSEHQSLASSEHQSLASSEHQSLASSEHQRLISPEHQLSRTSEHLASASSEPTPQASANDQSLVSTGHHPSVSSEHHSLASAEHHVPASGVEQHHLIQVEPQQTTSHPEIAGPQARRPVKQSSLEKGELCVSGDHSNPVSRQHSIESPENRMRSESDVSESAQLRERGDSCPDCVKCAAAMALLHPQSRQLWLSVPGHCCSKMYCDLMHTLKERFPGDKCLLSKSSLSLLKHVLDVPLAEDVTEVSQQKFLDAERYFGPLVVSDRRCVFLANVENLATKSKSGGPNSPSWFAGRMDTATAENYLERQRKGTFLVRFCSSAPASEGSFAISVVAETQTKDRVVQHFLVQGNPEATKIDPSSLHLTFHNRAFRSLTEAVDHARKSGVLQEGHERVVFTQVCPRLPLHHALSPYR